MNLQATSQRSWVSFMLVGLFISLNLFLVYRRMWPPVGPIPPEVQPSLRMDAEKNMAADTIRIEQPVTKLGRFPEGTELQAEILLTNISQAALTVLNVGTTDSCFSTT